MKNENTLLGIFYMLMAVSVLTVMDGLTKHVATSYSFVQIFFFRSFFSLFLLIWYLKRTGQLRHLKSDRKMLHLARGFFVILATACFVYAMAYIPLGSMYAIQYTAPIFITMMSAAFLKERVSKECWYAVLMGFAGVVYIVSPDTDQSFQIEAAIALAGAVIYAYSTIQIRQLSLTESAGQIVFYFLLISIVSMGVILPFNWVTPSSFDLMCLVGAGLVGGVGQILFTLAFSQKNLAVVSPFSYFGILCAVLMGWAIWDEMPSSRVWIGGLIIILSGAYVTFQEHKAKKA